MVCLHVVLSRARTRARALYYAQIVIYKASDHPVFHSIYYS